MDLKEQILHHKSQNVVYSKNLDLNLKEFENIGFPTTKNEEWKYTSVKDIVSKSFSITKKVDFTSDEILKLNIHTKADYFLVFVNGIYNASVSKLDDTIFNIYTSDSKEFEAHKNSYFQYKKYNKDGFIALNNSFSKNGIFIKIAKNKVIKNPIFVYYINDCSEENSLALPNIAFHIGENSEATFVDFFIKKGNNITLTNAIIEFVLEENSQTTYYKILHEGTDANHIGTTQINQNGKSIFNSTTIVLSGNIVRNNLNISLNSSFSETHLYGLSLLNGTTHVDNHTVVDHAMPSCESNELYKAILDEKSTSVFNGKIFVRKDAQKTNAYQSSKNILLSNDAEANSKPQLEIWADDVKCSHGHATGQLNKDHIFYLKARGIGENEAIRMLTQAYAQDILNNITIENLKSYCENEIAKRFNTQN